MGVTAIKNGKYRARFSHEGKRINLGTYKNKPEALRQLALAQDSVRIQLPYTLDDWDYTKNFLGRPLVKKPTLKGRLVNAYHAFRSNTKSEK